MATHESVEELDEPCLREPEAGEQLDERLALLVLGVRAVGELVDSVEQRAAEAAAEAGSQGRAQPPAAVLLGGHFRLASSRRGERSLGGRRERLSIEGERELAREQLLVGACKCLIRLVRCSGVRWGPKLSAGGKTIKNELRELQFALTSKLKRKVEFGAKNKSTSLNLHY